MTDLLSGPLSGSIARAGADGTAADGLPDALLIGTGPLMLIEGLRRAEAGQRVVFADRATALGGAWKTPSMMGFDGVETGVHLIENRAPVNAAFAALLGPGGLVVNPPDFGYALGRRLPMRLTRILLYGLVGGKALAAGRRDRTLHALRNAVSATAAAGVPLVYPAGGFAAALRCFETRLAAAGARIRFGTEITGVTVAGDHIRAAIRQSGTGGRGEVRGEIRARQLVMSSRAHAPVAGLEPLWADVEQSRARNLVLRLAGPPPRFAGYVEFLGDRLVKRVRRLAAVPAGPTSAGHILVTVQIRNGGSGARLTGDLLTRRAAARLRQTGLLGPGTAVLDSREITSEIATLPVRSLARIGARHGSQIRILHSVDLSDAAADLRAHPLQPQPADPDRPPGAAPAM